MTIGEKTTERYPRSHDTAPPPRACLLVVYSPDEAAVGRTYVLEPGRDLLLGREVGSENVEFRDPRVSRVHARVFLDSCAGVWSIADANSTNGTFLDGQAVRAAAMKNNDVVRVGDTLIVVSFDEALHLSESLIAASSFPLSVLLTGEPGVGKEVAARWIHSQDKKSGSCSPPFIALNCGALSPELAMSELFGHRRGAFSGAHSDRAGAFALANGGTLFLDEIGELPLQVQPMLLRALENKCVRPLGADRETPISVRVISATNRDLEREIERGAFREDLYSRIAQLKHHILPLRERRRELIGLAIALAQECGRQLSLSATAAESMLLWPWPFNVRELKTLIALFVTASSLGQVLDEGFLHRVNAKFGERGKVERGRLEDEAAPEIGLSQSREGLIAAMSKAKGNVAAAARLLQTSRSQVYRLMLRYNLRAEGERSERALVENCSERDG